MQCDWVPPPVLQGILSLSVSRNNKVKEKSIFGAMLVVAHKPKSVSDLHWLPEECSLLRENSYELQATVPQIPSQIAWMRQVFEGTI